MNETRIKKIYLHLGVHKTASTTIQETLGRFRGVLEKEGYLYPEFFLDTQRIYNHSIPIYNLFTEFPELYHINLSKQITSALAIAEMNSNYRKQLENQINEFKGEHLIISGEDISVLSKTALSKFVEYLRSLTDKEVRVMVILFCRNPNGWVRSSVQEVVKNSLSLNEAFDRYSRLSKSNYKRLLTKIFSIFPKEDFVVIRYEDAIKNEAGPVGAFLECISANSLIPLLSENRIYNRSLSYEAVKLHSFIHTFLNENPDPPKIPLTQKYKHALVEAVPGIPFALDQHQSEIIASNAQEDYDWLCSAFDLPPYSESEVEKLDFYNAWSKMTLEFLQSTLPNHPEEIRIQILYTLEEELKQHSSDFTPAQRIRIQNFLNENGVIVGSNTLKNQIAQKVKMLKNKFFAK
jgi:hypothetical protein